MPNPLAIINVDGAQICEVALERGYGHVRSRGIPRVAGRLQVGPYFEESTEDGVVTLALNRPDCLNSYDLEMLVQFGEAVVRVSEREDVKVVVLRGRGGAFCGGVRMSMLFELLDRGDLRTLRRLLEVTRDTLHRLRRIPQFCIASVDGVAADGGFNLVLSADYSVAAESARFGYPFLRLGLSPEVGSASLLRARLGTTPPPDLVLSGRLLGASAVLKLGLLHETVETVKLPERTRRLAAWASSLPPVVCRSLKRAHQGFESTWESSTTGEIEARMRCFLSRDFQEGIRALRENRAPRFRGM